MAARDNKLSNDPAPARPATATIGMELICEVFETGQAAVGKVIGQDDRWVRLRIDDLERDWLVRPDRIDLAKGTWQHVAADYPAIAEQSDFDAEFRPAKTVKQDPAKAKAIADAAAALKALLPEALKGSVDDLAQGASDRLVGGPSGSVLARWTGKGTLDAPFLERKTRATKRGATTGAEGWFPKPTVEKYKRHFETL
jgi:hypothetical protein